MIRALITGKLYGEPTARTSQSGKPFTTAKVKADGKDGATAWCSIIAFGELAERLATFKANDVVAMAGRCELAAWLDKSGNPAAGLSLVADEIATLKGKPKPRVRAQPQESPGGVPFDDALPDWS